VVLLEVLLEVIHLAVVFLVQQVIIVVKKRQCPLPVQLAHLGQILVVKFCQTVLHVAKELMTPLLLQEQLTVAFVQQILIARHLLLCQRVQHTQFQFKVVHPNWHVDVVLGTFVHMLKRF
jgi:hypothetical protein